jgi:hypothetical protein
MKKFIVLVLGLFLCYSCLDEHNNDLNFEYKLLTIDEYTAPASFTFGETDTIKVKYSLPNGCHSFNSIYYEYKDTARIVAVRSLVALNKDCTQAITQEEYKFLVTANQTKDYVFQFWKGTDSNGENIFEDVVVPVN